MIHDEMTRGFHFTITQNFKDMLKRNDFYHIEPCPQEGYTLDEMARILKVDLHMVEDLYFKYRDNIEPIVPKFADDKGVRYRWKD